MRLVWSRLAHADLVRLHAFLSPVAPRAANAIVRDLIAAAERLADMPRIGQRVDGYGSREVRRLIVGNYEMRYEVRERDIGIVRIWHCKEDR
ncbi:MAG TPA: type II toxin-antitoxin system RelE/ParE family toxin [Caulobacteraceae bacterium]